MGWLLRRGWREHCISQGSAADCISTVPPMTAEMRERLFCVGAAQRSARPVQRFLEQPRGVGGAARVRLAHLRVQPRPFGRRSCPGTVGKRGVVRGGAYSGHRQGEHHLSRTVRPLRLQAPGRPLTYRHGLGGRVAQSVAATRPNILWICTDQQRADTIAARGNPSTRTPVFELAGARRGGAAQRLPPVAHLLTQPRQLYDRTLPELDPRYRKRAGTVGRSRAAGVEAARGRRLRLRHSGQAAPVARRGPGGSASRRRLPQLPMESRAAESLGGAATPTAPGLPTAACRPQRSPNWPVCPRNCTTAVGAGKQ